MSGSLFENKVIIIKRATDKTLKYYLKLFQKKLMIYGIADSDKLEKKSKLRSFFERKMRLYSIYPIMNKLFLNLFNFLKIFFFQHQTLILLLIEQW